MRPSTIKQQVSAGGVIFRQRDGVIEICLIATKGGTVWCLPKGIVDTGERPEDTALREVKEETGLEAEIIDKIGKISYWYFMKDDNTKYHKTVHFYLMHYLKGSTDDHDWEVDDSRWYSLQEAERLVSYKGDREILGKAKEMILSRRQL